VTRYDPFEDSGDEEKSIEIQKSQKNISATTSTNKRPKKKTAEVNTPKVYIHIFI
jgi:hypothetical protein